MHLIRLLIKNYKNIDNIEFIFNNRTINYITGENAIGKSNIIEVIYSIFTSKYNLFSDTDFKNSDIPIEIECDIEIECTEEIFSEFIDPENEKKILLVRYEQNKEEYNWIYNKSCTLRKNLLRDYILCYKYVPEGFSDNFFKSKLIGKFINELIEYKVKEKSQNDNNPFENIINHYNDEVSKELNNIFISIFKIPLPELELNITLNEVHNILFHFFELVNLQFDDKKLFINQLGRGRGYYLYPMLDFLAFLYDNKDKIIVGSNILILFDEPEVYLSPFLQRQFMTNWLTLNNNMINEILNINETDKHQYEINPNFFIATHSSLIISHLDLNNIENRLAIHRMYYNNNKINISSLTEKIAILKQFSIFDKNILEGLFARKVILVEGDTEIGFLPLALEANNLNIHNEHIHIIKSSPGNFINLANIFSQLNIQTYILTDRDCDKSKENIIDKNGNKVKSYKDENGEYICRRVVELKNNFRSNNNIKIFVSDYWDFEESILYCLKHQYLEIYKEIEEIHKDKDVFKTHFGHDEIFIKKLEKMRDRKKTIEDSYKLINAIVQSHNTEFNLNNDALYNSNGHYSIAADSHSVVLRLPNYISQLIMELQSAK